MAKLCPIHVDGIVTVLIWFSTLLNRHTSLLYTKTFFLQSQLPLFDVKLVHFMQMFKMCLLLHCFCELCEVLGGSYTRCWKKTHLFLFKFETKIPTVMPAKQQGYEAHLLLFKFETMIPNVMPAKVFSLSPACRNTCVGGGCTKVM